MAFKGITFAGQNVTPKNDGALYNAHYGDGILDGCTMTISGDDLVIASGHFIAGGRVCQVDGATSVDLSGRTLQTGYIQVIMNYDLTQGEGSQWYTSFVESATTTFPALTTDDINGTGTLYQVQLAVIQISGGNLTDITSQVINSPLISQRLRHYDSDGNVAGQLFFDGNGNAYLGGNSDGSIYLRPNGTASTNGQVFWDGDGQQHGGHPVSEKNLSGASSVTANSVKSLLSFTGLTSSGIYLASGLLWFTPSSGTTAEIILSFNTNASYLGTWRTEITTASTSVKYVVLTAIYTGVSSLYLNMSSGVAGSAGTNTGFKLIRLA